MGKISSEKKNANTTLETENPRLEKDEVKEAENKAIDAQKNVEALRNKRREEDKTTSR